MQFETMNCAIVADLTAGELQNAVDADQQMSLLRSTVQNGWPEENASCPVAIRPFRDFRDELTVYDGIVVKGQTIAVPLNLRSNMWDCRILPARVQTRASREQESSISGLEWLETSQLQWRSVKYVPELRRDKSVSRCSNPSHQKKHGVESVWT